MKRAWNRDFKEGVERPLAIVAVSSFLLGDRSNLPAEEYMTIATITAYPYSRGYVHATGPAVNNLPDFEAGILSHEVDLPILVWAYKKQREIARRMKHYSGGVLTGHPAFDQGSNANFAVAEEMTRDGTPKDSLEDIKYSEGRRRSNQGILTTKHRYLMA